MSYLREIAIKAKWDGAFAEDWPTLQRRLSREGALQLLPGQSDLEKLRIWAEGHGLSMDFEVELAGFWSEISSVSFRNEGQPAVDDQAALDSPAGERPSSETAAQVPCNTAHSEESEDYFDWTSLDGR